MTDLAKVLSDSARLVDDALALAREELAQLDQRKAQLEALIAQAEAMQRTRIPGAAAARALTLHEAIATILREAGNPWMTVRDLADAVNTRALYHKKDGTPVEMNQIHARTKNYTALFEKDGSNVRLRNDEGEQR